MHWVIASTKTRSKKSSSGITRSPSRSSAVMRGVRVLAVVATKTLMVAVRSLGGPMRRSDQRRDAVFALYQHEVTGRPLADLLEDAKPFTRELAEGAEAEARRARRAIPRHSRGWTLERIAPLERNIMRVALYEALTETTSRPRSRSTRPSSSRRSTAAPRRRDSSMGSSARRAGRRRD